jgi:hypothetical protein
MATADAEDAAFVRDYCPAEFRDVKVVLKVYLMRHCLVYIVEVNVLRAPFKVVHEL